MTKFLLLFIALIPNLLIAQIKIKGTVYDKSKVNYVEYVKVLSTGGEFAYTDSIGNYEIVANSNDSLSFVHNGKATMQFPVSSIADKNHFDISLQLSIPSRYTYLKEVRVYSKSYKQDSAENRKEYQKIFDFEKPRLESSLGADGMAGADLNQIFDMFKFRRNKSLKALQTIMIELEEDKYVNYRFSKVNVRRITGLSGNLLDTFLVRYRPNYYFIKDKSDTEFYEYVLQQFYQYQRLLNLSGIKPE